MLIPRIKLKMSNCISLRHISQGEESSSCGRIKFYKIGVYLFSSAAIITLIAFVVLIFISDQTQTIAATFVLFTIFTISSMLLWLCYDPREPTADQRMAIP